MRAVEIQRQKESAEAGTEENKGKKEKLNSENKWFCGVCKAWNSSIDGFRAHLKGGPHARSVKALLKQGKPLPKITLPTAEDEKKETEKREASKGGVKSPAAKVAKSDGAIKKPVYF